MKVRIYQDGKEKKRRVPRSCPWSVEWRQNGRRRCKTIGAKADAYDAHLPLSLQTAQAGKPGPQQRE